MFAPLAPQPEGKAIGVIERNKLSEGKMKWKMKAKGGGS